jgi:VCBS repeat-containing protein
MMPWTGDPAPHPGTDAAPDIGGRSVSIDVSTSAAVRLPEGFPLWSANFARAGADLVATGPDGGGVVLHGFFTVADPPELTSADGARISGDLVAGLARPEAPVQLAEALFGPGPAAVGTVEIVDGSLAVDRADGTRVGLAAGDALFSGDTVETGPDGTADISLADAVRFGIGPASRLIVASADPAAETPITLAVEPGTYALACGSTSRPLIVDTPTGRIDAEGAQMVLTYGADGSLEVILLPDEDGSVGGLIVANDAGALSLEQPYQWVTANGGDSAPQTHGVLSIDEIVAGYGPVLHGLPAGCAATPVIIAANPPADPAADLSAMALAALVEFETGAGGDDPGDAPAPAERIVVTHADPLAGGSDPAAAAAPPSLSPPTQAQSDAGSGGFASGPNTTNEQILESLVAQQGAPRQTFPKPPPTADPPIPVALTVPDWSISSWTTLVPQYPSHRDQQELYRVLDGGYDEPEPLVATPLPSQVVRTFEASDGSPMVLMAAGPLGSPLETGRGVEIEDVEDPNRLGLPPGTLATEIVGANPSDGAVMWAVRAVAAGTTIRFDWMFDGRDEPGFDDFAAFTVAGSVASVAETSVYELARNADVGGFGATGWRTSEWTFDPVDGAATTLTLGFVVMNDGSDNNDDANEPRLLIDNVRIDTPVEGDAQPLGDPQVKTLGTLTTFGPVPTASDDAVATYENDALSIAAGTLLANDLSPTGVQSLAITAVTVNPTTVGTATLASDGTIRYDPVGRFDGLAAGAIATDTFGYTIADVNGATGTAVVTVTITGVNDAPKAADDAFATDEDAPVGGNVLADNGKGADSDIDGTTLTVTAVNGVAANIGGEIALVSGALLTVAADGTFAYDPDGRFEGLLAGETATDSFTYTVDDGSGGTDTATVVLTVKGINDLPTARDDSGKTDEDNPIAIALTANDGDPEGAPLTVSAVDTSATTGQVTVNGDGSATYDPAGRFDALAAGETATDSFGYVIDDGSGGTAAATVTVTVHGVNDRPTAVDDALSTDEDSAIAIAAGTLLANDTDPDATDVLTVTAVDNAATAGTVTLAPDGTITYDPGKHFDALPAGETATDSFGYTIGDGHGGSATATATIAIAGVNDAPTAQNDTATTDEHSSVRIAAQRILTNDSDPDTGETPKLAVTDVDASGTIGTVVLNVDGSVTYDPAGRFADLAFGDTGTDAFTYTVADPGGGTATATVTVTIEGRNEASTPQGELIASFEETGTETGTLPPEWDRIKPLTSEPVSVISDYTETDGARGAFAPTDGSQMVELEAFGSFANPVTPVADFLGVPRTSLPRDSDGSDAQDGSAMKTTILVQAGDEISFDWMFDGRDLLGTGNQAFNDFAVLTVAGDGGSQVFKLADVRSTDGPGASGWRTSTFLASADSELTIGFAVMNDEASHGPEDVRNSRLLVDNVRVNRELGDDYQVLEGQPGDNFRTWVQAPTADDDTAATTEDAAVTLTAADLLANDAPPGVGGTIGIVDVDAGPAVGEVTRAADGTITYDPRGRFDALGEGETATDGFLYTVAADNGGTGVARVEMTITGVNDAPVAADDTLATDEDTGLAGNVLADNGAGGDADAEGDALTVTRVNGIAADVGGQLALASGALLVVTADGTFAYDPAGHFDALKPGETATDTFTYTVDDGHGGADTATVALTVTGVNDAPTAAADTASTSEDASIVIAPAGNDTDPEGDTLAVTGIDASATTGVVTLNPDGTVGYDPGSGFNALGQGEEGTDSFAYTLDDGHGGIASGTVSVTVTGLNDVPMATLDSASTNEDETATLDVLAGASDPDTGDSLSVSALDDGATTGIVTLNADGTITYDPAGRFDALTDGETAEDTFAYTLADGHGGTATQTVTVTINGVGGGPSAPGALLESFDAPVDANDTRGLVLIAHQYNEPDGNHDQFLPTDGTGMAFLEASGAFPVQIESFLGLADPFAADGDNSTAADGAALRVTVDIRAGDEISFDWMFDANDIVTPPLGDFLRSGFNDFAVFAAEGQAFTLSDVRQTYDETGSRLGASGWRTSVYTAQSDGPLTIGFAVVNDDVSSNDSHLLVDNVRLDRAFGDGYQVVDSQAGGIFETVVHV